MTDSQASGNCAGDTESNEKSNVPPTDLEGKIIRQIEYYFGDINLNKDKFLQEQIKLDNGWIQIDTLLKFNRLSYLSKDKGIIVNALTKSESGLMEISEDKIKVRRSPNKPIPEMNEDKRKEIMSRTVYCKGFPKETTKMDKLLDFFQQYGKIDNIIMRNWQDKATKTWSFKGSTFVVFPSVEDADSFLKLESVKYENTELLKMFQNDYIEMKRKERLEAKGNKKARAELKGDNDEAQTNFEKEKQLRTGSVIQVSGLTQNIMREHLREKIEGLGFSVAYLDFNKGDEGGWVRLDEQDSAKELIKKLEGNKGKMEICDTEITVTIPSEDEEAKYLKTVKETLSKKRFFGKGKKKGKRGGMGRGGWNMRKRKGSPPEEGPTPAKVKPENYK